MKMFQEGKIDATTAMQMLSANQASQQGVKRPSDEASEASAMAPNAKQAKVNKPPESWEPCLRYGCIAAC